MPSSKSNIQLLAFAPHPDDVELFCSGLLLAAKHQGHTTGIVDLSRGELSSQGSIEKRERESAAASKVLNLDIRENLGLPDGSIGVGSDAEEQLKTVVCALRRLRPSFVVVPYEKARHPDHSNASALLSRAVFFAGVKNFASEKEKAHRVGGVFYYSMRVEAKPSFIVDISAFRSKKLEAIQCYSSQTVRSDEKANTLISSPLSLTSLEARDAHYGAKIGAAYGEPYVVRTGVSISDPVKHFSENPTAEALSFFK